MSLLKSIFGKKDEPIRTYADFWNWFRKNEKEFHNVFKAKKDIEKGFFDQLSAKLSHLKEGYYFLAGMIDDKTVEMIFTADGNIKNMVFIEELVAAAPAIDGWLFKAHKTPVDLDDLQIKMSDLSFNSTNLFFYTNEDPDYPDVIDIAVYHPDITEDNKQQIGNGIFIFLDNYLGELDFANNIDNISIAEEQESGRDLVPIFKLKDYINWRQKEFVEKYEGTIYDSSGDNFSVLEGEIENYYPLIAMVNTGLLHWDRKASHPWVSVFTIHYMANKNGLPGDNADMLNEIEDEILVHLKDVEGYLYIGRQTAKGKRDIYFACKDFRKPAKVFETIRKARGSDIEYDIYKDKYWQTFERFMVN
jgi:hypothetical protein